METTQTELDKAITTAAAEVKDCIAQVYLRAIPKAIETYGMEGLETQLLYALANMGQWRGEVARQTKTTMKNWLKQQHNLEKV
jgi:hypothetical protein